MSRWLVCIDVGNSRTKAGLFRDDAFDPLAGELPSCLGARAIVHGQARADELCRALPISRADEVRGIIAGSNPDGVACMVETWPAEWASPFLLDDAGRCPLEIRLDAPNKAGMDRILNAVACNVVRPAGHPAIIVDTGTATTVDAVSPEGAFEGGAILPGFELCARALNQYTALLPFITIEELSEESHEPLGRSTREALRSGLLWGQIGAINELVQRLRDRWQRAPLLALTGGGAPLAAPHLPLSRWEPHLSLQGLAIVAASLAKDDP